jgi:hypothetical protein
MMQLVYHTWKPQQPHVQGLMAETLLAYAQSDLRPSAFHVTEDTDGSFEYAGIRKVWELAADYDGYIGYWHTKGAKHIANNCVADWRRYMVHFFLQGPDSGTDLTGVNWTQRPWPHFSGNFWWARASYLRRLPEPVRVDSNMYWEEWVGQCAPSVTCRWSSGRNHYHEQYPRDHYVTSSG